MRRCGRPRAAIQIMSLLWWFPLLLRPPCSLSCEVATLQSRCMADADLLSRPRKVGIGNASDLASTRLEGPSPEVARVADAEVGLREMALAVIG